MTEHAAATRGDLDELASKLEAFGEQLPPSQQAVLRALLVKAADDPDEVTGFTVHADNLLVADTRHTAPDPGRPFSVMGVVLFYY